MESPDINDVPKAPVRQTSLEVYKHRRYAAYNKAVVKTLFREGVLSATMLQGAGEGLSEDEVFGYVYRVGTDNDLGAHVFYRTHRTSISKALKKARREEVEELRNFGYRMTVVDSILALNIDPVLSVFLKCDEIHSSSS
jgi:predicted YcjX-like family ATPase